MEVLVKNCSISKTHISKMTYNHVHNILACNIDGNDTILFYQFDFQSLGFVQIFKGSSKPPGNKTSIAWSPDGKYLALGSANIQLWQLKENRLKPLKTFHQQFVQIKIIQWSVDSTNYACGGISQRNTIRIRNIQTGKTKQLPLPQHQTISGISFDPYGKYLFLLYRNNTVQIYSIVNYQSQKVINLSPSNVKINPIKQIRTPCWSPDFNFFVCPSLDDSRINIAINLSRSKDFKVKNIFMGHCTPISCCKFNPKLYKWNNQITSILALGDSSGNISIWRIGIKNEYQQPLILSNSLQNSMQVVEDIEWDQKGEVLLVNMMKKYIHVIKFSNKTKDFGIQLSNQEVFNLIQQIYGSTRATDVNKRQIQIFNFASEWNNSIEEEQKIDKIQRIQQIINPQIPIINQQIKEKQPQKSTNQNTNNRIQQQTPSNLLIQHQQKPINSSLLPQIPIYQNKSPIQSFQKPSFQIPIVSEQQRNQFIKLSQQKTIIGKNNKKKIQPAMMIRKAEISQLSIGNNITQRLNLSGSLNKNPNGLYFSNSMVQTFPSLYFTPINFNQKQIVLSKTKIIQIKKLNKVTAIQLIDLTLQNTHVTRRVFPLAVDYIHVCQRFIYILNQNFLYIFDTDLNPKQLPLKVGSIHKFVSNNEGEIYFINCDGYLIGFDHQKNINKTLAPVPLHLLLKDSTAVGFDSSLLSIKQLTLSSNSQVFITIQNENPNANQKYQKYIYDPKINGWAKLNFQQGILQPGFSIKINDSQQNTAKNFFVSLCPSLKQRLINQDKYNDNKKIDNLNTNSVLSYQQQSLIYYKKYHRDNQKLQNSIIQNFRNLKLLQKNYQFRKLVQQYFFDIRNKNYVANQNQRMKLWERLKREVGGVIIQEFQVGISNNEDAMVLE